MKIYGKDNYEDFQENQSKLLFVCLAIYLFIYIWNISSKFHKVCTKYKLISHDFIKISTITSIKGVNDINLRGVNEIVKKKNDNLLKLKETLLILLNLE